MYNKTVIEFSLMTVVLLLYRGEPGLQGPTGDKGDQGDIGLRGRDGDKGDEGEKGQPGEKGIQGMKGTADGKNLRFISNMNQYVSEKKPTKQNALRH